MSEPEPHPSSEPDGEDEQAPDAVPAGLVDERFATNIRELRGKEKLSQGELARRMAELGFPYYQQTIRRIEEGRRKVSVGEAEALARILGTSIDRLTWPGQVASAAYLMDTSIARAQRAWNDIARATARLLWSLGQLRGVAADVEKRDCLGSDHIREIVREAGMVLGMNPEDAVRTGRADYENVLPEEMEQREAEEDLHLGGADDERE
jgi:transcriptional regulator with XRE-family HTH domain